MSQPRLQWQEHSDGVRIGDMQAALSAFAAPTCRTLNDM